MVVGKPHITKQYERWRIREPSEFRKGSFRTHDIGRKGWSKRIAGRLKKGNEWATQAILISRKEPYWVKFSVRQGVKGLLKRTAREKK